MNSRELEIGGETPSYCISDYTARKQSEEGELDIMQVAHITNLRGLFL